MATPPRSSALTHAEVAELLQSSAPPRWAYLDVRTPQEFATGHVPGAYNIPYQLGDEAGLHPNPEFVTLVAATFPVHAQLIVGCRSGGRAAAAERALAASGYERLRVHLGSLMGARDAFGRSQPGWIQAGYTVTETASPGRTHAELNANRFGVKPTQC